MSLRCIRCGRPIEGLAQLCEECAAEEEKASIFLPGQTAPAPVEITSVSEGSQSSPSRCRACGQFVPIGAEFCPMCGKATGPGAREFAGFWVRLVAAIIDYLILVAVWIVLAFIITDTIGLVFMQLLLGFAYTVGFWLVEGATPGKMVMGIRLVMADGTPLTLGAAVVRFFSYIPSAIILLLGYLLIGITREKRGLHDFIAGTVAIKSR